jgi:hypothetical protein
MKNENKIKKDLIFVFIFTLIVFLILKVKSSHTDNFKPIKYENQNKKNNSNGRRN